MINNLHQPNSHLSKNALLQFKKRLLQMHFESGVGHIGGNLSALDAMLIIYNEFIHENDSQVGWANSRIVCPRITLPNIMI